MRTTGGEEEGEEGEEEEEEEPGRGRSRPTVGWKRAWPQVTMPAGRVAASSSGRESGRAMQRSPLARAYSAKQPGGLSE
jgi:hypothetical protein